VVFRFCEHDSLHNFDFFVGSAFAASVCEGGKEERSRKSGLCKETKNTERQN
jgi:hypothetical protein